MFELASLRRCEEHRKSKLFSFHSFRMLFWTPNHTSNFSSGAAESGKEDRQQDFLLVFINDYDESTKTKWPMWILSFSFVLFHFIFLGTQIRECAGNMKQVFSFEASSSMVVAGKTERRTERSTENRITIV